MNKLSLLAIFIFLMASCKKQVESSVYIRINNTTETSFSNIDIANSSYGSVLPQITSDYKLITKPLYAAGCVVTVSDSSFYIGYLVCGTPMPAPLNNGKYTLSIKTSVSTPNNYEVDLKKDQ